MSIVVEVEDKTVSQGLNATIQLSSVDEGLSPGQEILLWERGKDRCQENYGQVTGVVRCLHTCCLQDVPERYLSIETNHAARTREGLITCLVKRHGAKLGNSLAEQKLALVTVIVFEA